MLVFWAEWGLKDDGSFKDTMDTTIIDVIIYGQDGKRPRLLLITVILSNNTKNGVWTLMSVWISSSFWWWSSQIHQEEMTTGTASKPAPISYPADYFTPCSVTKRSNIPHWYSSIARFEVTLLTESPVLTPARLRFSPETFSWDVGLSTLATLVNPHRRCSLETSIEWSSRTLERFLIFVLVYIFDVRPKLIMTLSWL